MTPWSAGEQAAESHGQWAPSAQRTAPPGLTCHGRRQEDTGRTAASGRAEAGVKVGHQGPPGLTSWENSLLELKKNSTLLTRRFLSWLPRVQ